MRDKGISFFFSLVIGLTPLACAQNDVASYMTEVLDILEGNAEHRGSVDWTALRQDALEQTKDLETTADTHPIIRDLLAELRDPNGYLLGSPASAGPSGPLNARMGFRVLLPDWVVVYVWPGSPADNAGIKVGDRLVSVNGVSATEVDVSDAPEVPGGAGAVYSECEVGSADYCRLLTQIYTPGSDLEVSRSGESSTRRYVLDESEYDGQLFPVGRQFGDIGYVEIPPAGSEATNQATRRIIDQQKRSCGWIVDIRRHAGGAYASFNTIYPLWDSENKTGLPQAQPPTAYLLSHLTYSGGEGVAYMLAEQSGTRSFGEHTGGNHPRMGMFTLSDGAVLAVTRISIRHLPDVEIRNDWTRFQTEDDPVIQAAVGWLNEQPSCRQKR